MPERARSATFEAVLFLLFGSSAAGKTFALDAMRGRVANVAIHDFDEIGVPSDADATWRQHTNEVWIGRALVYQRQGLDLLLAGQTPIGELLATPSAPLLEAVASCLLDCDDPTRVARLRDREPTRPRQSADEREAHLRWAEWMRRHAEDPTWRPEVIQQGSSDALRWERWSAWQRGDPRWRVRVIDTTALPVEHVAEQLTNWIDEERLLLRSGVHPLRRWADHEDDC